MSRVNADDVDAIYDAQRDQAMLDRAAEKQAVVAAFQHQSWGFWTGTHWSPEYPDALLFTDDGAVAAAHALRELQPDEEIEAFSRWGFDDERTLTNRK